MIFSLLRIRKKTSSRLAGIAIGAACLWGVALWQDLTADQLLSILGGTVLFVGGIVLIAVLLIGSLKVVLFLLGKLRRKFDAVPDTLTAKEVEEKSGSSD